MSESYNRIISRKNASKHLWVGNLPDDMSESEIKDYFTKWGRVEAVKKLPKKDPSGGLAAFIDFESMEAAVSCHQDKHMIGRQEIRTDYNYERRFVDYRKYPSTGTTNPPPGAPRRVWRPTRPKSSSRSVSLSRSRSHSISRSR